MDSEQSTRVFGEAYMDVASSYLTAERSDREARLICELAGLRPGQRVLDVGCGCGRIAHRLAGRGLRVVGLDNSLNALRRGGATSNEGGAAKLVLGDVASPPFAQAFDLVFSWYTSFGFNDDPESKRALRTMVDMVVPGGKLLLDLPNRRAVLQAFRPIVVERKGDRIMIDYSRIENTGTRAHKRRLFLRAGQLESEVQYSIRLFSLEELTDWMLEAGLKSVQAWNEKGRVLTGEGRRMILIGQQPTTDELS